MSTMLPARGCDACGTRGSAQARRQGGQDLTQATRPGSPVCMEPLKFEALIRPWDAERSGGLSVADVPADLIPAFGGLKQVRVTGTIGSADFTSSVMPAGGGRLALSVSKAMMQSAGVGVGDEAEFTITRVGA